MAVTSDAPALPRPRADKRDAIIRAARAVFARMGYSRASTQVIAGEANVSTRTLYNHFPSKDELFRAVLVEGAEQVADAFTAYAATIDASAGAEAAVLAIGRALAAHRLDFPEHFAMAQQIAVERDHFPAGLLDDWQRTGPQRVEREVARLIASLAASGSVVADDAVEAAGQLILLTAGAVAFHAPPGTRISPQAAEAIVARGVRTFLYGHAS